ncbi:hypothetical protein ElyMa_003736100 [Elysia marginata]|uniref:Uncharacterized protein n=1 Tax=Elysia marginata TaxID=1093978 RepID=A0AAV4F8C6_9GAST|nr:hypothetical protein ElyMa_003736100 [Elysia marginata]
MKRPEGLEEKENLINHLAPNISHDEKTSKTGNSGELEASRVWLSVADVAVFDVGTQAGNRICQHQLSALHTCTASTHSVWSPRRGLIDFFSFTTGTALYRELLRCSRLLLFYSFKVP